jgi:hypothetical protein
MYLSTYIYIYTYSCIRYAEGRDNRTVKEQMYAVIASTGAAFSSPAIKKDSSTTSLRNRVMAALRQCEGLEGHIVLYTGVAQE